MANGTIPSWDEWNSQLTQEQRNYSLYKILQSMEAKLNHCPAQISKCNVRFKKIENKEITNTVLSTGGGIIGGILAVLGKWAIWK